MERLYKALAWLAGVAIVLGLVIAYLFSTSAVNQIQQSFSYSGSDGLFVAFLSVLRSQVVNVALNLSSLLDGGAVLLGVALAWVARRHVWLAALVVVALLTLVWPAFFMAWQNLQAPLLFQGDPQSRIEIYNLVSLSVPLIPVALALIFALVRRRRQEITAAASDTDAELGVVRSAL